MVSSPSVLSRWLSLQTVVAVAVALLPFWYSNNNNVQAYSPLAGVTVQPVRSSSGGDSSSRETTIDVGEWLSRPAPSLPGNNNDKKKSLSMIVFGTYAADFNAVEYGQRLRYYWPALQERGVDRCALVLNCQPSAATKLCKLVDLAPRNGDDSSSSTSISIEIFVDNTGAAGRAFSVGRGWIPDNADVSPFLKLFGMLWGLGAWATLPAVIGGYIGNPFTAQPWIEDALVVGMKQGRWPDNAIDITTNGMGGEEVVKNKFAELPLVGTWARRPLELATLRLQSMLGISLQNWKDLAPDEEALAAGVLTQLGGCLVIDRRAMDADRNNDKNAVVYEWRDPGICAVANFEDILKKL